MRCFYYFKHRREHKSAPIFKNQSKTDISEAEKATTSTSLHSINELYEEKALRLRVFTFSDLKQATNNFSRLFKIGEGGFGSVYRGTIKPIDGKSDPFVVAIKKLNKDGNQGHKQWVAEVQFLGVVKHPNLIKLIGYCAADGERGIQRLLVYEYMANKSLEDHLFDMAYPALDWDRRLSIVLGAAQGLAYLHEEIEVQVIYRDFKSSNVLLDDDFKPKLSDFGLAREGPITGHTHVSTAVVGTYGYAAPDYIETGHLTAKSDVWSFGVVLYEILTGRRSLDRDRPRSEQKLLDWVKHYPVNSRKFGMIMDPRLKGQYSLSVARKVAKLANRCLVKSSKDRPKMSEVGETLKQIVLQATGEECPSANNFESVEDKMVEDKHEKRMGVSESAKRRMPHLAELSENVGGISRRRFIFMQRTKVT